jgi:predicted GNAT family acetyltransferase
MTEIQQGNHKFYVGENEEQPQAEITFVPTSDSSITINHTFVSDELRGQGMGEQLVKKVAEYARTEHKTIIPECPFAKKVLESNSDYQDVL